jgi:predicted PurR-regulated permease PerM
LAFAASLALLYVFRAVLWPMALALAMWVLINALIHRITRVWPRASRWTVRIAAGLIVGALAIGATLIAIQGGEALARKAPVMVERVDQLLLQGCHAVGSRACVSPATLLSKLDLASLLRSAFGQAQSAVSGIVLAILYLAFFLATSDLIRTKLGIIATERPSSNMTLILERTARGLQSYVWVHTLTGLMTAVASGLVMLAFGLDNVLFWTLALFLLTYLPVIGIALGSIAPSLFALLQFSTFWPAVAIFVSIQAIAFIVGNMILPRLQAQSQNIDAVAGMVAVLVWSILWGIPGALLAVPLTMAAMFQFAQFDSLRWIAILISNDGRPFPEAEPRGVRAPPSSDSAAAPGRGAAAD